MLNGLCLATHKAVFSHCTQFTTGRFSHPDPTRKLDFGASPTGAVDLLNNRVFRDGNSMGVCGEEEEGGGLKGLLKVVTVWETRP